MNKQTTQVAMLGLLLVWFCARCGQSKQDPSITVPPDCQKFLVKYFDAIKSKDIGKIEEYSSAVAGNGNNSQIAVFSGLQTLRANIR